MELIKIKRMMKNMEMLSNEFINEIVENYTTVLNDDEWEELEYKGNYHDTDNHLMTDVSPSACIEVLGESGFSENEIKQLFDGNYMRDGGMWGMIPHETTLYTTERKDFYILTMNVREF